MELFQRILKTAVEGGASDVHLKIADAGGVPDQSAVNGN
jgi:type II secretory ATPase GspE/PulE/Tfp pilus assembly ATPase PilB-like protein